jgi:CDP-diacylglycerol--serine O-phosphatidyltransferase
VARRLLPFGRADRMRSRVGDLAAFAVPAKGVVTLTDPASFRERLLAAIATAQRRIVIVALYLEDDDAGRELLAALHDAHDRQPGLDISVFVDWHRAQRGLIGKARSEGNAGMYRSVAAERGPGVKIYGVPVQGRELFGVLHLKGMVIDDAVLYSGASINNVYLARHGRYRLDRYHVLCQAGLADAMAGFVQREFAAQPAVCRLDQQPVPTTAALVPAIRAFRQRLAQADYAVPRDALAAGEVAVTPMAGFGRSDNALNQTLLALLRDARERVVLLTPYFNLPRPVRAVLGLLLRRGCTVEIMVGDKTANDFFVPPDEPFRTIGVLPYLYEANLRRFARTHQRQLDSGQLRLHLWRHGNNSFHLKGLFIDDDVSVLTGNNLNPRAWSLDLENALLLRDPDGLLREQHAAEWIALKRHATRLRDYRTLETTRDYPAPVRKLLRRLKGVRLDRLANRLL